MKKQSILLMLIAITIFVANCTKNNNNNPVAAAGTIVWGSRVFTVKQVTNTSQQNATLYTFQCNTSADSVVALTVSVDNSLTTAGTYPFTNNVLPLANGKISYSMNLSITNSGTFVYEVSLLDKSGSSTVTKNNGKTQIVSNNSQAHKPNLSLGSLLSFNVEY